MSTLKVTPLNREFVLNGTRIPDPAPALSVEQVREMLTPSFPEIATATLTGPEDTGICDTVVINRSTAILIESKLATCRSSIRYSGKFELMKEFLEERLVRDVGVSQLRNAIDLLTGSSASVPTWVTRITKFIPVIVTRDDIGSCWFVNAYLNDRFEENLQRKKYRPYTITKLVTMNVGSLERCMKELKRRSFSEVLESRIRANKDMIWTFDKACKYVGRARLVD